MAPKPKKQKKKPSHNDDECGAMTEILMLLSPSDNENNSSSSDDDDVDQENVSPSTSRRRDDASEPEDNDDKNDKDYRPDRRAPKRKLPNRPRSIWLAPSESSTNLARLLTPMPRVPLQTINPNIDLNNNNDVIRTAAPQTSEPSRSDEVIEDEIPLPLYAKESFYRDCANGVVQREFNLLSDLINNYSYEEYDRETRECMKESAEQAKDSIRSGDYFYLGKHVLEFRYAGELDPAAHSIHLYASNNTDRYLKILAFKT
jgi:hypothetical protein